MDNVLIRQATVADLEAINAIYNHFVLHSTCTYQVEPDVPAQRRAWFDGHGPQHPVVVAESAGQVLGWGSLSPLHPRAAFRYSVEDSVYVRPDAQGRGAGGALLKDLILRGGQLGHHTIVAAIDGEQKCSLAMHTKHGFVEAVRLRQVGFKFGRWLDMVYMQLML
jgi:phosphinothricin acetyltransferase